ncbi:MAG: FtsX-like permease family protein [Synergistaceae bacterium]|nr:FtsX-like permease family protein [Synergistaceae bacterium]
MTNRRMYFKMIASSILRRKSRMTVALLAVAIGATVLLGLSAISYDIPRQMGREFRNYGANMIFVPADDNAKLEILAAKRAAEAIPADSLIGMTPYRYETARINMRGYDIVGVDFGQARKTSPFWRIEGKYPEAENEVLLGADIADFTQLAPGAEVNMTGLAADGSRYRSDMKISGIVRTGGVEDGFIFLRLDDLERLAGNPGTADIVELSAAAGADQLNALVSRIAGDVQGITPKLVRRVTHSETTALSKLRALILLVSAVVLALTMICVATTMMTVVMERRREIGLKKALGADNGGIAMEFIGEGILLGAGGGALGSVLGYFMSEAVSVNVFGRSVTMPWYFPVLAILASVAVTAIACLPPVRRATQVEPALVLRGE